MIESPAMMKAVRCEVVRWVADEPQPGWVEASFIDAQGQRWSFLDKPPVFGADIHRGSELPVPAMIRCEIVASRRDSREAEVLEVRLLDGIESDDGSVLFVVRSDQVIGA